MISELISHMFSALWSNEAMLNEKGCLVTGVSPDPYPPCSGGVMSSR